VLSPKQNLELGYFLAMKIPKKFSFVSFHSPHLIGNSSCLPHMITWVRCELWIIIPQVVKL
jgi:hypothetical protein